MNYKEYGDPHADCILFLHGGGVSGWMWKHQIRALSHHYCLVPDLPEQGQSQAPPLFSIQQSAEQLLQLVAEKAAGKKVTVIGFSLGAQIALHMLSLQPHTIHKAIINSALVRPALYAIPWIKPMVKLFLPLAKYHWFAKIQAKVLYIQEDDLEVYYKESSQMKADTLIRILSENMSYAIPDTFHKSSTPILVTVGKKENNIMRKSAIDIVSAHPHSKGLIISNVGHGFPLARPELFNQMVEAWIHGRSIEHPAFQPILPKA